MITALVALLVVSGARADSSESPVHVSLIVGPRVGDVLGHPLWFEFGCELDVLGGFLRADGAIPVTSPFATEVQMDSGQSRPEPTRVAFTAAVGKTWSKDDRWLSVGGGWSWARSDELKTAPEYRQVLVETGNGLESARSGCSAYETCGGMGWVWIEPKYADGPYFFGEVGLTNDLMGLGFKMEYRFSMQAGLNLRLRLPVF